MMLAEPELLSSDIACVRGAVSVEKFKRDRSLLVVARAPKYLLSLPEHRKGRQQTSSR
jgi:hypothetical protein